jgi:hypothetical protein
MEKRLKGKLLILYSVYWTSFFFPISSVFYRSFEWSEYIFILCMETRIVLYTWIYRIAQQNIAYFTTIDWVVLNACSTKYARMPSIDYNIHTYMHPTGQNLTLIITSDRKNNKHT